MTALARLAHERTDLTEAELDQVRALTTEWSLIADLALSDLVLWLPTWNDGGFVAGAHVRPATGPTTIPQDIVGSFLSRTRSRVLDRVLALRTSITERDPATPLVPAPVEAHPVLQQGRIIAVVERRAALGARTIGRLEEHYLEAADLLLAMVSAGSFPDAESVARTEEPPRAGDGLIRLDERGRVRFASPNAQSAFHRLGLAVDLEGADLASLSARLVHRPGPVDEALSVVAGGRAAGEAEVDNGVATLTLRSLPLRRDARPLGALVLVRDVTDLRRRDRALLTKDATIREVHHRVKNNLQTVAALLRLQARRTTHPDARAALDEAVRRVAAIGLVHETLASSADSDERVQFDEVVDRLLPLVTEVAPGSSVHARREGSFGTLPARIATPLSVVLTEVLHNAAEHGIVPQGSGSVVVRVQQAAGVLVVEVVDDGIGIGTDAQDGLGLQIVRTLVEDELGATMSVDGGPDGGTVVRLTVPLPPARDRGRD